MFFNKQVKYPLLLVSTTILIFSQCKNETEVNFSVFEDSSAIAYGPYRILKLPITKGVTIQNPIQVSLGPGAWMYAANASGTVYRLLDSDGDGIEDEARFYCSVADDGLHSPGGFASREDTIFIGTREEVRAYLDRDKDGRSDSSWTFFNQIPHSEHPYEWISGICFGKDGWLYGAITTDSWNAGASPDPNGYRGSIIRISPDGKNAERLVTGIRSVYGMGFHSDGQLYFTDNEGGGNPTEELNQLIAGKFYGHNRKKFGTTDSTEKPILSLQAELAPSGIEFNRINNDFGGTAGQLFIAFYGPSERWKRGGIARVNFQPNKEGVLEAKEFSVAEIPKLTDLGFGKDGSLYVATHGVADYWYNPIKESTGGFYKLVYDPKLVGKHPTRKEIKEEILAESSIEKGKDLFMKTACFACHATDGTTDLLGPNLKDIYKRLSREDIYGEITEPSKIIKPSMEGIKLTKSDGKVLLGRIVNANEEQVDLMLIGNQVIQVKRSEIKTAEPQKKSLMYEGLIANLSKEDQESLLDYLMNIK
ncbi:DUF7133 domain-containing protein [Flavihumibacter sp. UBA7668]|uniref:DUF7133 domain-containing protein n=1 Tax=Flavihumibacter sp. UBA7668 TaxID=1946542 RepID=UPI0025C13AE4|nr:PQQ-dependent sugar dehydrogenase [Flavihumibacter sp. UBA7668]